MTALLAFHGVEARRGTTHILHDINWTIREDENWVLFGPNGAGKSTLLSIATGYFWPSAGSVSILGETLGEVELQELRKRIAIVSEPLRSLISADLTGLEVLITGVRAHLNIFDPPTRSEIRLAAEIAAATATESLLERPFTVMSTGERQRLLIARAMMTEPALIILDEPCAGLDLAGREFVLQLISDIACQAGAPALLLTTHHVEEITDAFSHMLVLKQGRAMAAGPLDETLTSDVLSATFEMPINVLRQDGRYAAFLDDQVSSAVRDR